MQQLQQTSEVYPQISREDPLFIVLNVGSGHNEVHDRVTSIKTIIGEKRQRYKMFIVDKTQALSELTRQAVSLAQSQNGVVVAAGGDGTISAVAREVLPSGCRFGVLPHGTFNFFSRTHNIPSDMDEAIRVLLQATVRPVQVGLVNQHLFLVNASLGLYAQVFEDREHYKQKFGRSKIVALGAMFVTLLRDHRRLTLHLNSEQNEQVVQILSLVVGNNALQLERLGVPDVPALELGYLIAIAVRPVNVFGLLRLAYQGAIGQLRNAEHVKSFAFQRLLVNQRFPFRHRRVQVALDGELTRLRLPLLFEVSPTPLNLLVPSSLAA